MFSQAIDDEEIMKIPYYTLMLVTHKNNTPIHEYLRFIQCCAESGITALQLREKNASYTELLELGTQLKHILTPFDIPLIINDNVDLAIELNADGVHLGQSDACPIDARERLGAEKIIGLSIDSVENLHAANQLPINYVGIGAVFPTATKHNVATIWGVEGLSRLSALSKHPVVAIGGINESNTSNVKCAGAHGIAVISALHDSTDLQNTVHNLRHHIGVTS